MKSTQINNIAIIGLGYVGCAMSALLAQRINAVGFDIDRSKVNLLKNKKVPIKDDDLGTFMIEEKLNLDFKHLDEFDAKNFDAILISTPTDFNEASEYFDTTSVEKTIANSLAQNPEISIVIKSTIPIGFTEKMRNKYASSKIYFSPEFLREGKALHDNLYPDRIVFGGSGEFADSFVKILQKCSRNNCAAVMVTDAPSEAECVKLFSNTYIAMRVAFFNEIDSFCMSKNLNTRAIINGIGLDSRIGNHYNNPSFGFGGYCLPKDSKQAKAELSRIPSPLISAVSISNEQRINFIAEHILRNKPKSVGLYRVGMKSGSDNTRDAAIIRVAQILDLNRIEINVFDDATPAALIPEGFNFISDKSKFFEKSDIIIANRLETGEHTPEKAIFTRDLFHIN